MAKYRSSAEKLNILEWHFGPLRSTFLAFYALLILAKIARKSRGMYPLENQPPCLGGPFSTILDHIGPLKTRKSSKFIKIHQKELQKPKISF